MGSWNKTCGISNLHINGGEEVVVFALVKNKEVDSFCYTTPFYAPLMFPFYSHYNDYGVGENSSGFGMSVVVNATKEFMVEIDEGENRYHEIAVKKEGWDIDKFFEAVRENRLTVRTVRGPAKVAMVMIKRDIWDYIFNNYTFTHVWFSGPKKAKYNRRKYKFKNIEKDIPAVVDYLVELHGKLSGYGSYLDALGELHNSKNCAAPFLMGDTYRHARIMHIDEHIRVYLKIGDKIGLTEFLTEYVKARFIDYYMSSARKVWIPQGHEGSQNTEHEAHHTLIAAMQESMEKERKKYGENEYCD